MSVVSEPGWAARLHMAGAHSLYLHVPFCASKCAYCDFASWATRPGDPLVGAYLDALRLQVRLVRDAGLLGECRTAYVGGGTPTLAGSAAAGLVGDVRRACPRIEELTCEANPESLGDDVLAALLAAGCTRLSLGVQSLDDAELADLGRIHDARTAAERVRAAVARGADVSCDLMCATPLQTDGSWAATLGRAVALGTSHVSVYPLQVEEGTPYGRRYLGEPCPWNGEDVQARRMEAARSALETAGYERYEVASYARPGHECRHNEAYWTGMPYLGLGTGASGMLTLEGYSRLRVLCPQLPTLDQPCARVRLTVRSGRRQIADDPSPAALSFSLELLDEAQAAAEDLMVGARLVRGLDPGLVDHARDVLGARVDEALSSLLDEGLLHEADGRLAPTERGWLLGNELCGALWDLAPGPVRELRCGT